MYPEFFQWAGRASKYLETRVDMTMEIKSWLISLKNEVNPQTKEIILTIPLSINGARCSERIRITT